MLAVALITACGSGGSASYEQTHSASQILADADLATRSTASYHVSISANAESGYAIAEMDIEDTNAAGTLTSNGIVLRMIHVKDQTFMFGAGLGDVIQPSNPQLAAAVRAKAAGKWVLVPSDIWTAAFRKLLDLRTMSSCLKGAEGMAKKGTATASGQSVVRLDDKAGSQVYVQTSAPHHFVHLVLSASESCSTDSTAKGETIDLLKFGTRFQITAPSGYIDLATLAAGG